MAIIASVAEYIHELERWPNYSYDSLALAGGLERVNLGRGRLFGLLQAIGFEEGREQDVMAVSEELVKSSAIEGESLDLEAVRSSVARRLGVDRGGLVTADHYVDGLVEMTLDAALRHDKPLTEDRIFNWHAALFPTGRNAFGPIEVGRWRTDREGPMAVISHKWGREVIHYQAPSADRVPSEMTSFLRWVESDNEGSLILKAGIAHLWFETIHPMDDGNGRIGRTIMDLLLARADKSAHRPYSLASHIHAKRGEYYRVLEATQRGALDYTQWLEWYLETLLRAVQEAFNSAEKAVIRAKFWSQIKDVALNERQRKLVSRMLMGWEGRVTNKKYSSLCRCSDATATRDLSDLVSKAILRPDGAGGRSAGYELVVPE